LLQVLKKDICFGVQTATEFLVMPLVLHSVLSFPVVARAVCLHVANLSVHDSTAKLTKEVGDYI